MKVFFENDQLNAQTWGGTFQCIPISETKFWSHSVQLYSEHDTPSYTTIEFIENDAGVVDELILFNRNKETRWKRLN